MENKEKKENIESTTTFNERRKVLIHRSKEEKKNELGDLIISTEAVIHEEGIRTTLKDLDKKRKMLKEHMQKLEEVLGEKPEMTPELEELKSKLITLQLIDHQEKATEESTKKEKEQLENSKKDLKMVEKDLRDIKQAIGSRMKL